MRRASGAPAIIGINLDPIGAVTDLIAHHARQAVNTVGFFSALRHAPFSGVTLWTIAARGHDCARHYEHTWTGNDSLLHRLLETYIRITCAFRSQIANGSKAGQ